MSNLKFPNYRNMYPYISQQPILKRIRNYIRFYIRKLFCKKQISQLLYYLGKKRVWFNVFEQDLYRFNALLTIYCDKRFNKQKRVDSIINNFDIAEDKLDLKIWSDIIRQKSIIISNIADNLTINININEIDPLEGFFSINIQDIGSKKRLYDASFSFMENKNLLISSIQGPKGDDAQDIVRQLTKNLNGIRPMFFLVICFKILARHWKLNLVGIPHIYQAKYRWNDSSKLLFNYDEFWKDNDAKLTNGYWNIPLDIERKSFEEIVSKKRSMYRKRYEMIDNLNIDIASFLKQ
ncbi:VirK/YbjX family protein [Ursidibacter arcticus]